MFVSTFQLVSGAAYCSGLSGKRYSEVAGLHLAVSSASVNKNIQNVAFPSADTPGCQLVQKPRPINWLTKLSTDFTYSSKEKSFRFIQKQLA